MAINTDRLRRTGRTTRTLIEALSVAGGGGYVIVFSANDRQIFDLVAETTRICRTGNIEIKRAGEDKLYIGTNGGSVSFVSRHDPLVDMQKGTYIGAHPSCKIMADHYALETYLQESWAFRELTRNLREE